MRIWLVFLFVIFGLACYSQNELYVVSRSDSSISRRIAKGSFLRVETADGKRYSGTLVRVKDLDIVLMAYDATIDIEEIIMLEVVYKKGHVGISPVSIYSLGYSSGV